MLATAGGSGGGGWCREGRLSSKGQLPHPGTDNQWTKVFIDGERELHVETARSAVTGNFFFLINLFILFIYLWLRWVFVAVRGFP